MEIKEGDTKIVLPPPISIGLRYLLTLAEELRRQDAVGRSYITGKGIGRALHRRLHLRLLVRDTLLDRNLLAGIAGRSLLNRSRGRLLRIALHPPRGISAGRLRNRLSLHRYRGLLRITVCRRDAASVSHVCFAVPKCLIHIYRGAAQGFTVADFLNRLQSAPNPPVALLIKGKQIDTDTGITAGVDLALIINIVAGNIHDSGLAGGGGVKEPVALILLALFKIFRISVTQGPFEAGGKIGSPQALRLSRLHRIIQRDIELVNGCLVAFGDQDTGW